MMVTRPLLARLRALSRAEVVATLQYCVLIPLLALSLWLHGYKRTLSLLTRMAVARPTPPSYKAARVHTLVCALRRAKRRAPYRGNCLSQSLALWWQLHRAGMTPEIRFGVRRQDARLDAHAWVELDGHVLNDRRDVAERYKVLPGPPNYQLKFERP